MAETFSTPGIGDVSPDEVLRLGGLLRHYCGMAKTFTTCKRDQMKHGLPEEHANRRCAVIKLLCGKKVGGGH